MSVSLQPLGMLWVAGLLSAAIGCAPSIRPLGPMPPPRLAPDEGLLILHVDSDAPLRSVLLDEGLVAESLDSGRHVWMMRAAAGRYCWRGVRPFGRGELQVPDQEQRCFEVEPGAINYAGALIVRTPLPSLIGARALWVRLGNRGATAIRRLRERQPEMLVAFPIRYSGPGHDAFLEYYERVRRTSGGLHAEEPAP